MKTILKITLGILLASAILIGGCTALVGASVDKASKTTAPVANASAAVKHHTSKPGPTMTSGQKNALDAAQSYIDMSGFSKRGIIHQLSSKAADGYSRADAVFAANHVKANWNAEAVESAKGYLEMSSFSRSGLIHQLSSKVADGYTLAQATYAASRAY